MDALYGLDAFSPREISENVQAGGVAKARLPLLSMAMLGMVAGGFIGLGALFSTVVLSDPDLGFAASRVLGGLTFSLGLILVVVAGAELFTGNNLLVMAWADRRIGTWEMLRNWLVVYVANAVGAMGLAVIVWLSHHGDMNGGAIALQYVKIASAKASLPFAEAFFKGVLCNLLVCLAVWIAMAGRSVSCRSLSATSSAAASWWRWCTSSSTAAARASARNDGVIPAHAGIQRRRNHRVQGTPRPECSFLTGAPTESG
jgi:formate/nitrite transporter